MILVNLSFFRQCRISKMWDQLTVRRCPSLCGVKNKVWGFSSCVYQTLQRLLHILHECASLHKQWNWKKQKRKKKRRNKKVLDSDACLLSVLPIDLNITGRLCTFRFFSSTARRCSAVQRLLPGGTSAINCRDLVTDQSLVHSPDTHTFRSTVVDIIELKGHKLKKKKKISI